MTRIKTIASTFLNDPRISLGAKGLYVYINAKDQLWTGNTQDISCETSNTPEDIEIYEKELIDSGYMERTFADENDGVKTYSYTLLKKTGSKTSEIDRQNVKKIFAFWNAQGVIIHKAITPNMYHQIEKNLSIYTVDEICTAIENYANVQNSKLTYWDHKWTLDEFMQRKTALPIFLYKGVEHYLDKENANARKFEKVIVQEEKKQEEFQSNRDDFIKKQREAQLAQELKEYWLTLSEDERNQIKNEANRRLEHRHELRQSFPQAFENLLRVTIKAVTSEKKNGLFSKKQTVGQI